MSVIYMLFLDSSSLTDADALWYSVGLFVFNLVLMGVLFYAALEGIKKLQKLIEDLRVLNEQLVKDKEEDRQKFAEEWIKLGQGEMALLSVSGDLALRSALPNGKQPSPRQSPSLADVDALIAEADEVAPACHEFLRDLVKKHNGDYLQGPNKTRTRAVEKIENDYGGDHTKLVDVVRASAM